MDLLGSPDFTSRTDVNHAHFRDWIRGLYGAAGANESAAASGQSGFEIIGSPGYVATTAAIASEEIKFNSLIEEMKLLYEELVRRRIDITRKKVLISPIQSLPHEVLARIFTSLPSDRFPEGAKRRFDIMSVCHKWRDVFNNTPELWRDISWPTAMLAGYLGMKTPLMQRLSGQPVQFPPGVGLAASNRDRRIPPYEALTSWMERAKAVELDVTLRIGRGMGSVSSDIGTSRTHAVGSNEGAGVAPSSSDSVPNTFTTQSMSQLAQLAAGTTYILSQSLRFQALKVSLTFSKDDMSAWTNLTCALQNASRLESLHLDPTRGNSHTHTHHGPEAIMMADEHGGEPVDEPWWIIRKLREALSEQTITLSSLTSLVIRGSALFLFYELICARSLLSLEIDTFPGAADPFGVLIILSKQFPILRKLRVAGFSRRDMAYTNEVLEFPNLRVLDLEGCMLSRLFQSPVISSASGLRELRISTEPLWTTAAKENEQPLPFLPYLETLHLRIPPQSGRRGPGTRAPATWNHPSQGQMRMDGAIPAARKQWTQDRHEPPKTNVFASVPSLRYLKLAFVFGPWTGRLSTYLGMIAAELSRNDTSFGDGVVCARLESVEWEWNTGPKMEGRRRDLEADSPSEFAQLNRLALGLPDGAKIPRDGTNWEIYKRLLASCLLIAAARQAIPGSDADYSSGKGKGKVESDKNPSRCRYTLRNWHSVFPDLERVSIEGLLDAFAMLPEAVSSESDAGTTETAVNQIRISIDDESDFETPYPVGLGQRHPQTKPRKLPMVTVKEKLSLSAVIASLRSQLDFRDPFADSPLVIPETEAKQILQYDIFDTQELTDEHYADAFDSGTRNGIRGMHPGVSRRMRDHQDLDPGWGIAPQW